MSRGPRWECPLWQHITWGKRFCVVHGLCSSCCGELSSITWKVRKLADEIIAMCIPHDGASCCVLDMGPVGRSGSGSCGHSAKHAERFEV